MLSKIVVAFMFCGLLAASVASQAADDSSSDGQVKNGANLPECHEKCYSGKLSPADRKKYGCDLQCSVRLGLPTLVASNAADDSSSEGQVKNGANVPWCNEKCYNGKLSPADREKYGCDSQSRTE